MEVFAVGRLKVFLAIVLIVFSTMMMSCSSQDNIATTQEEKSTKDISTTDETTQELTEEVTTEEVDVYANEVNDIIDYMNLEEKVAQLFIVYPESLVPGVNCVTAAGEATKESINNIPVGGVIYMSENLRNPEQTKTMLSNIQNYSIERTGLPILLCVDEEGGQTARIASNPAFEIEDVGDMSDIGASKDLQNAYDTGAYIGKYLHELGFNLDFAPDTDVKSSTFNPLIQRRAFSDDPEVVAEMASQYIKGLKDNKVIGVYKHFPGHGSTSGDPHKGYAFTSMTLDDLKKSDLKPFEKGIEEGVPAIMVGHISLPNIITDGTPASLSKEIIGGLLRNDMNFQGVVITDAMNMNAINDRYTPKEAAVMAIEAGADIVLMSKDFREAYQGVLDEIESGRISEERIDESVERIIRLKLEIKYANNEN
ncbi:MAG: glycoside hydrolase family 3 protein [Lachnospiraceae bacterium]|nr:glycoside hydrolase family 3 protein [Lachnospiraceae bacterium]